MLEPRVCPTCGKTFVPKVASQRYCSSPHTATCPICGKEYTYFGSPNNCPKSCSRECSYKLQEQTKVRTLQERYGVSNVNELESVRKKISDSNSSKAVRAKREQTNLRKYGVKNVSQADEIRSKLSEVMRSEEYQNGRKQTCLEKYGYESPSQHPEVKEKRRQTNIARYGSDGLVVTRSTMASMMIDGSKVDEYLAFKEDPAKYISSRYDHAPSIGELERDLGVTNTPIYNILIQHSCSDLIFHSCSSIECEVLQFLSSILPDAKIVKNDRKQIHPLELDFYLPDYKIGIECNPGSTHNSSIYSMFSDPLPYTYHQRKTELCEERGIFLFHIFGYEWKLHNSIMKSMLRNILGKNTESIGARETYVDEISNTECVKFLNENHRQGAISAKIRLGLRRKSDDSLISVMTFGNLRSTMGKSAQEVNSLELSRFCTKLNINVAGGASKLFQHFLKQYRPEKVVSFSDRAHTKGTLYEKLGFQQVSKTPPSYFYTNIDDTKFLSRVACQKHNLSNLFKADVDLSKTEHDILKEHGYVRVYDCGVIRWEYT